MKYAPAFAMALAAAVALALKADGAFNLGLLVAAVLAVLIEPNP